MANAPSRTSEDQKFIDELFWVLCNRCLKRVRDVEMYILSCKCIFCEDCLHKAIVNHRCRSCHASQVCFKPINKELPAEALDLFRPLKDQPSLEKMVRHDRFKRKQVSKALEIHSRFETHYEKLFEKKEEELNALEEKVKRQERMLEEQEQKFKAKYRKLMKGLSQSVYKPPRSGTGKGSWKKDGSPFLTF